MAAGSAVGATRRVITLFQVLSDHGKGGATAKQLIAQVGYGKNYDSGRDQLGRDIRHLRSAGFRIDSIGGEGAEGRYRLVPTDDRIVMRFSPEERAELNRAAILVKAEGLSGIGVSQELRPQEEARPAISPPQVPETLTLVQRAVALAALVKFEYAGRRRTVDPWGLSVAQRGWVLYGFERDSGEEKTFSLQRMSSVKIGEPGSATRPDRAERPTLDPRRWRKNPPVPAEVWVPEEFLTDALRDLHEPAETRPAERDGVPGHLLTYEVTNHVYFCWLVLQLDRRVVLVGGSEIRAVLAKLLVGLMEVA